MGLRLSNVAKLPTERFEVYNQAVQLLVADHPANRRVAAAVTTQRQRLSDRQLRELLARVAFVSQVRGDLSTIQEAVLRQDFLGVLRDPNYLGMNAADAAYNADELLNVAEGELGLLVRKGPAELGFLHRMLQEQLAAEHMSAQLDPAELDDLFTERVRDPRWREVLLATMWQLRRPSELRGLMNAIRARIDETPAGLRTREILAEIIFGPYGLPATDIHQSVPAIVEVIETHPYGPHRARLLESFLTGLEGAVTGDIVRGCLERWTLLVQHPSSELVLEIAQLPPNERLSEIICKLLVRGLRYPDKSIAYTSAIAIAGRCTSGGPGSNEERCLLRAELLHILSDPPSGLAQAAALTALALDWRDDQLIVDILNEARGHTEESVRVVALSDALGVLRTTFSCAPATFVGGVQPLSDDEREWLIGRLCTDDPTDSHGGLLAAAVSEAARGQDSTLEALVESLKSEPYGRSDLIWPVALSVLADDDRVVDIVCDQLSTEHSSLNSRLLMGNELLLSPAYPPESSHSARVAAAVEDRVRIFKAKISDRELWGLAAVDRGPMMKAALLEDLVNSSWPHWASEALVKYFGDDVDARTALHSVLMGDPVRASMIANAATKVLAAGEVVPRLLAILRDLAGSGYPRQARYGLVASAIIQACKEQGIEPGPEIEPIAAEALKLMPTDFDPVRGDPRHHFAANLYPSTSSKTALRELAQVEDRPLAPYLRAFRHDAEQVQPFLDAASKVLCSLPAYLRARVCQSLADEAVAPELGMHLTRRWADDVSRSNKSIASLAFHRALLRAREEGHIDHEEWDLAMAHLGEQASCYGWDHECRRRSAWVGMCACGDWSTLEGRLETIGKPTPVGTPLTDVLYGSDMILLQQLASRWKDLRSKFGDALFARLSGTLERLSGTLEMEQSGAVWDALALVAAQDATLQQQLESAVADDPELLRLNGVMVWFVTRGSTSADAVSDALVSYLQNDDYHRESPIDIFWAEPERLGLDREDLRGRLENVLAELPGNLDGPVLEALAVLFPEHLAVLDAWQELSAMIADQRDSGGHHLVRPSAYYALAYAAADSSEILKQIERNSDRLDEIGNTYFDNTLTRHVSHRLRRDPIAAGMVRDAVMNPATPDNRAALLASFFADALGLDEDLLHEVERRIAAQNEVVLAPVIRDRAASATLSVRTIFTRVADGAWDVRST